MAKQRLTVSEKLDKWDKRFMAQAKTVAGWSKDYKHRVGAVIVDDWNRLISEGYNGPPRGTKDKGSLDREELRYRSLHAELNAILFAKQNLDGCKIYIYPSLPCAQCCAVIIQSGIKEVVVCENQEVLSSWNESIKIGAQMLEEAGVLVTILFEV